MASRFKRNNNDPNVKISKQLSYILRHGAVKEGFTLMSGGFIYLDEILQHPKFKGVLVSDIEKIVEESDKKRFHIETEPSGRKKIRANQGHTLTVDNLELREITDPSDFPEVVHGTYCSKWESIKSNGLSKMSRTHIHCAPGIAGDGVISGMRANCDLLIYIDIDKAMKDGIKFYLSANNVILSEGDYHGVIQCKYFKDVVKRKTMEKFNF